MQVIGKTRIFKDEYGGNTFYNTSVSRKLEDGTYKNMRVSVQFKKGQETAGDIEITNGFLSNYEDKNRNAKSKNSNYGIYKGGRRRSAILIKNK
jgi:hypothetical protein